MDLKPNRDHDFSTFIEFLASIILEMSALIGKLCAGAVFGAALTAAGVYSPWIIIEQMKLRNFHMLQAFITATASSA